ncbi:hypothetical protein ACIPLA_26990 [Pseudomonas sp. NPDC086112]
MAHARRKFFELHATNKSMLAEQPCATSMMGLSRLTIIG